MSGDLNVVRPMARPGRVRPGRRRSGAGPVAPGLGPADGAPCRPSAPANGAIAAAYEDARLRILRSLERGEIDVAEAGLRLEALDGVGPARRRGRAGRDRAGRDDPP